AHKKNRPVRRSTDIRPPKPASSSRPSSGQSKNVQACTNRWSRQLRAPALNAPSHRVSPCRKKIRDTPSLFKSSGCKLPPLAPGAGINHANTTARPIPTRNQSGRFMLENYFLARPAGRYLEFSHAYIGTRQARAVRLVDG